MVTLLHDRHKNLVVVGTNISLGWQSVPYTRLTIFGRVRAIKCQTVYFSLFPLWWSSRIFSHDFLMSVSIFRKLFWKGRIRTVGYKRKGVPHE
jgi:hypothetical protein